MAYKILKQFHPGTKNVWVEKLSDQDTVDILETRELAETKINQLYSQDSTRDYKLVKI